MLTSDELRKPYLPNFFDLYTNDYDKEEACPHANRELARAYIPPQQIKKLFPLMTSLEKGTVFPELDRPYRGFCKGKEAENE